MSIDNTDKRRDRKFFKDKEAKEYLSINRELNRLRSAKYSHQLVELPEPIRKGWKRFFVLRPDIARSKESDFFKGILALINTTVYSRNKEFLSKDWKTKQMKPISQGLAGLSKADFNKLSAKQKYYFTETYREINKKVYPHYVIEDQWRFVLKTEPHYVTHSFVLYPEIESRLAELNNRIEKGHLQAKIDKAMGVSYNGGRGNRGELKSWIMEKNVDVETRKTLLECEDYFTE